MSDPYVLRALTVAAVLAFVGLRPAMADDAAPRPSSSAGGDPLSTQASALDRLAADREPARIEQRFAADFARFAGSRENAEALLTGLRTGTPVTLSSTSVTASGSSATLTTITPPTRPMGYGSAYVSLSLARAQLAQYGISQPTPEQLQAALTGGSITVPSSAGSGTAPRTVTLNGVLSQRAAGMGWGEIAKANGFKLGPVLSAMKSANRGLEQPPARVAAVREDVGAPGEKSSGHATAPAHGYGRGVTTPVSGGGVVYGRSHAHAEARVASLDGAGHGMGKAHGVVGAKVSTAAVTTAAGGMPGNSGHAPGQAKSR